MVKINKVCFKYKEVVVFNDFNEEFATNKIHAIIAPSGSGKTTLLNLIAGVLTPNSGTIKKDKLVSYLFQTDRLIEELTVFQNLELVVKKIYKTKYKNKKTRRAQLIKEITKWLIMVGLEKNINSYPNELSFSMRRRVALVRAFIYPSKTILMDEPFSGFDINIKIETINYLKKLFKENKRTIIFVTHNVDEVLLLANNIYIYSKNNFILKKKITIKQDISKRDLSKHTFSSERKEIYNNLKK